MKCTFTLTLLIYIIKTNCNPPLEVSRRIGGPLRKPNRYPNYVVAICEYGFFSDSHLGMGTLITTSWIISSKYSFQNKDEKNLGPGDIVIYHGYLKYSKCNKYKINRIVRHGGVDLLLAKLTSPLNLNLKNLIELSWSECMEELRGVYYSFGEDSVSDSTYSPYLLYSHGNTVNQSMCGIMPLNYMCIMPIDGTEVRVGDLGAGFVTGWGPGPNFDPKVHTLVLAGVISRSQPMKKPNGQKTVGAWVVRISHYTDWINQNID